LSAPGIAGSDSRTSTSVSAAGSGSGAGATADGGADDAGGGGADAGFDSVEHPDSQSAATQVAALRTAVVRWGI
jgi:hypothetical protein